MSQGYFLGLSFELQYFTCFFPITPFVRILIPEFLKLMFQSLHFLNRFIVNFFIFLVLFLQLLKIFFRIFRGYGSVSILLGFDAKYLVLWRVISIGLSMFKYVDWPWLSHFIVCRSFVCNFRGTFFAFFDVGSELISMLLWMLSFYLPCLCCGIVFEWRRSSSIGRYYSRWMSMIFDHLFFQLSNFKTNVHRRFWVLSPMKSLFTFSYDFIFLHVPLNKMLSV